MSDLNGIITMKTQKIKERDEKIAELEAEIKHQSERIASGYESEQKHSGRITALNYTIAKLTNQHDQLINIIQTLTNILKEQADE